jgi:capsular polysaccharide biosynthesis protein
MTKPLSISFLFMKVIYNRNVLEWPFRKLIHRLLAENAGLGRQLLYLLSPTFSFCFNRNFAVAYVQVGQAELAYHFSKKLLIGTSFVSDSDQAVLLGTCLIAVLEGKISADEFISLFNTRPNARELRWEILRWTYEKVVELELNFSDDRLMLSDLELRKLQDLFYPYEFRIFQNRPQADLPETKVIVPCRQFQFDIPTALFKQVRNSRHSAYVPPFLLTKLTEVSIIDGNQVRRGNELIVFDEGAATSNRYVAGIWRHSIPLCTCGSHSLGVIARTKQTVLEQGFLLSGRVPTNYFHWLIEYLPKLLVNQFETLPPNMPIIINSDLAPQLVESLQTLLKRMGVTNPIYERAQGEELHVKTLWLPSNTLSHPDRFDIPFEEGAGVSQIHLDFLRQHLLPREIKSDIPKRLFVGRKTTANRGITNQLEIEQIARENGFFIFYPEDYDFASQVQHFAAAEAICATGGAALSNLIFVQEGTRVLGLVAERNASYAIQPNLAQFAGGDFRYLLGRSEFPRAYYRTEEAYVHANFSIAPQKFKQALNSFFQIN